MVVGKPALLVRSYKPGTLEPLQDLSTVSHVEPTSAIPFLLDVILRRHLEKFSCFVEMGTELCSFEQSDEGVTTILVKNGVSETFGTKWIIGADGAKSIVCKDGTRVVTGDIRLTRVGLNRVHWHRFRNFLEREVSLRSTDEIGNDGLQFFLFGRELDLTKIAQSEELVFETIASLIPTEITSNEVVWMSDFRANMRMVNKFGEGRVFVAGGIIHSPAGGQGLNSGVQDAKGIANKSLLETYSAERLPVISEMLEVTTSILDRTITSGDISAGRSRILYMLGINCRFGTIVLDEFVASVKPINCLTRGIWRLGTGHLMHPICCSAEPDATTLFGLHRPWYHTILVFAPSLADATPILGALEAYSKSVVRSTVVLLSSASVTPVASPVDLVLVDREGYACSAYLVEVGQTKAFVIWPDGVIGVMVHSAEGVKKYFSKIFFDT
ncbi:FAD binding domain-containing protein [Suillus tomentosus]|nr:FAD binding domain-containing protein [Suillus tomentosus]